MALALPAHAAQEVFDGLDPSLIGAELTTVLEGAELACQQDPSDSEVRRCTPLPQALNSIGGALVSTVEARFDERRLTRVTVYLPESRFAAMKPALLARLGQANEWSVKLRAGMGGEFDAAYLLWEYKDLVVVAQQFDQKIDRSSLIYGAPKTMAPLVKKIRAIPPGGSGDL